MLKTAGLTLRCASRVTQPCFPKTIHAGSIRWTSSLSALYSSGKSLDLPSLDTKWQSKWEQRAKEGKGKEDVEGAKDKKYILPMFPYPSGDLHLGHLRVYTISDVLARYQRMQGNDVLHPIGWDAFGLPAENAAIERGIHPKQWTEQNIAKMKSQLKGMNGQWDWDREFATCDPEFYKHTQRLFLLLHEHGLAYQAEAFVNYDPVDKTVLANEQVDANGISWRSGAKVEKKLLKQWFFKISKFRQELLDDLDALKESGNWPERVVTMQKHWIGKSTGSQVKFATTVPGHPSFDTVEVFTTRLDTLYGVQYIALAPSHPIVQELRKTNSELQSFLDTLSSLPPDSKAGYKLPEVKAENPLSSEETTPDATKAPIPIFVAPYVLGDYGEGAVMGVPGHDLRDNQFWKLNSPGEAARKVLQASQADPKQPDTLKGPFVHTGRLNTNSGPFEGQSSAKAANGLVKLLELKDRGSSVEKWRLRDWLISRQRYWGTPIPIIHCQTCGPVPVPDDQLPVVLPPATKHWGQGKSGNPLDDQHDWVNTNCPKCNAAAKRDTDTMDTFVDSSWYFMRFIDAKNGSLPFSPHLADKMLPVDLYIGGVEHAILHLLYARFISKFIATTGLWESNNRGEPFKQVLTQGMVHGKTYSDPSNGRFLKPNEVDLRTPSKPIVVATGDEAMVTFEKMSKSKYNGVDPGECIAKYGADATRAHILFQAPVSDVLEWDEAKISGVTRWLRRIYDHLAPRKAIFVTATLKKEEIRYSGISLEEQQEMLALTVPKANLAFNWKTLKESFDTGDVFSGKAHTIPKYIILFHMLGDPNLAYNPELQPQQKLLWRQVQTTIASVTQSYGSTYTLNTVVSDLMSLTNAIIDFTEQARQANPTQILLPHDLEKHLYADIFTINAWRALIRMLAPIAPAFAEECWSIVNPPKPVYKPSYILLPRRSGRRGFRSGKPLSWQTPAEYMRLREVFDNNPPPDVPLAFAHFTMPPSSDWSVFDAPFPVEDGSLAALKSEHIDCAVQVNGKLRFVVKIPAPVEGLEAEALKEWLLLEIGKTEEGQGEKFEKVFKGAKRVVVVRGGKTVNFVV